MATGYIINIYHVAMEMPIGYTPHQNSAWYITYNQRQIGVYQCYTTCWCSEVFGNIPLRLLALAVYAQKPPSQQVVWHRYGHGSYTCTSLQKACRSSYMPSAPFDWACIADAHLFAGIRYIIHKYTLSLYTLSGKIKGI